MRTMKKFWKKWQCVLYNIDRIESAYGNVMIRGWVADLDPENRTEISVRDGDGNPLNVYMERLVRPDVNQMVGKPGDYESGIHILIDRAVLNTPFVWLTFENGKKVQRVKIRVNTSTAVGRFLKSRKEPDPGEPLDYDLWIRRQMPGRREREEQRRERFEYEPLFSVVIPVYNTPLGFLKEIVDSVMNQTYGRVELCLADGSSSDEVRDYLRRHYGREKRLRYRRLKENKGISENTNAAIRMSFGDFIVFADHDDVLAADAMYEMVRALNENPAIDVIYTDEDKINSRGNAYFGPHFKPDFSMELLCCNNYICHLFAARRELVKQAGLLDTAYNGAQDLDFVLRCCEKARQIHHIPKVLYHWRTHPGSTAGNPESKKYAFEAGRRAVEAHYKRAGIAASVENTELLGRYRTRFEIQGEPLVTILIPNKDHVEDLRRCLESIREKTTYPNYEILIVENNSVEPETEAYYRSLEAGSCGAAAGIEGGPGGSGQPGNIRMLRYKGSFNYAAIHNYAVPCAQGEYVLLLNNDTEVLSPDWIQELLGICQKPDVGAVGAKLYYPDGTIQHAGVILGLCGVASHLYVGAAGDKDGYAARLVSVQDLSAVTAACMMTKRSAWEQAGGMEEELAVAYNDIDYCMRLRKAGLRVVFTPYAELTHYESKSRGLEDTEEKRRRLEEEAAIFKKKWQPELEAGDPFYNPNLSVTKTDCSLRG